MFNKTKDEILKTDGIGKSILIDMMERSKKELGYLQYSVPRYEFGTTEAVNYMMMNAKLMY